MKDDVRVIFSLIRQQTEMEGGEQEVGGRAMYQSNHQGLKKRGLGGARKLRLPVLWGEGYCERLGEDIRNRVTWEPMCGVPLPEVRKPRRQQSMVTLSSPLCLSLVALLWVP